MSRQRLLLTDAIVQCNKKVALFTDFHSPGTRGRACRMMQLEYALRTDLNYWIKHPFEFSDPILKPEYL